jgi:hypothetical protein
MMTDLFIGDVSERGRKHHYIDLLDSEFPQRGCGGRTHTSSSPRAWSKQRDVSIR